MKEEEKIAAGILFCPTDEELKKIKLKTHNLNIDFNNLHEDEKQKRWEILNKMLGEIGEGAFCGARRPPVRSSAAALRRSGHP